MHVNFFKNYRRFTSVIEQIAISAVNFITSLFVITIGSVSEFGVYSFLFAFSLLANGICATLVHRQMVLHLSPLPKKDRIRDFKSSVKHELFVLLVLIAIFLIVYAIYASFSRSEILLSPIIVVSFLLYVISINYFELFRQYLYVNDCQMNSLKVTLTFLASVLSLQAIFLLIDLNASTSVAIGYVVLFIALIIAILTNKICLKTLKDSPWPAPKQSFSLFKNYFKQGKFGSTGSVVTWLQNQSMGPLLMLIAGPLSVGYFNIGRLFAMPLATINQGLGNGATPTLRRIFVKSGKNHLRRELKKLGILNLCLALCYAATLFILDRFSVLNSFISDFEKIRFFVFFWMIMTTSTVIRYWIAQYFVITLRLNILLVIGLIAAACSISGLLISGLFFKNIEMATVFIVLGEFLSIIMLMTYIRKEKSIK